MQSSTMKIKLSRAGFAAPIVVIIIVVFIGLVAGGYFFFSQQKGEEASSPAPSAPSEKTLAQPEQAPEQTGVVEEYPKELVGLWKGDGGLRYAYDRAKGSFVPEGTSQDNFEFRADGTTCATWVQVEGGLKPNKCIEYREYTVQGDVIYSDTFSSSQSGLRGRMKWRVVNSKLEFIVETFMENKWLPLFKFFVEKTGL